MRRKIFVFVPIILSLSAAVFGAEKPDLRGLVEAALRNDPNRLQASELLRAAEADAAYERTRRLISGNVSADISKNGQIDSELDPGTTYNGALHATSLLPAGTQLNLGAGYGYRDTGLVESDSADFSASVNTPVFLNGKIVDPRLDEAAKASAIDLPLEAARINAMAGERDAADAIIRIALDAASAERANLLAEDRLNLADRELVIARVKRSYGSLSFRELGEVEKDADEARLGALQAKFRLDSMLRNLYSLTGMEPDSIDLCVLIAPHPDASILDIQGLENNPALLDAARKRRSADYQRILAGAEYAPNFKLAGTYSIPGPVARNELDEAKDSWSATAAISIALPTGAAKSRIKAVDAQVAAAYQGEAAVRLSVEKQVASAKDAYTAALAKEELRGVLLEQSQARLREVNSALESQTATELEAQWAQLAVDEAVAALEDDRTARFKAALDLYALGGLDPLELIAGSDSSR